MPSTLLFSINNEGRVYALSTGNATWREFLYLGLEFKKISAVSHFMWAIGSDRQVYLHVHGLDVPIRIKEESYENERWLPLEGFSSRLLPTDRYNFSTVDGTVNRAIDKIRLPSMAWQWESEWHLDCTFDGQPLDHDGWTYAVDFPAKYHIKKVWNSCVRRRKWVRFRRYSALNSWCAIAPLHKDPTEEPFIDIAIGGNNIPGAPSGTLMVWAITAHGRIMSRAGVSTTSPEGLRWVAINTPSGYEVSQICIGATGLVWGVLANGRAIVRSGVNRDAINGVNWLEVKPPNSGLKIKHVSVGTDSVWCVTDDNHAWFRRGIKGDASGTNEDAAIGSGWVEMIGNTLMVSVAANDQVFAIGSDDRALYYRFGVSASDPTGKKWRLIQCPMQLSRTTSIASIISRKSDSGSPTMKHRSLTGLDKEKARVETPVIPEIVDASRSAPSTNQKHRLWQKPIQSPHGAANTGSLDEKGHAYSKINLCDNQASSAEIYEISSKYFENPIRSVGSVVGTEAHPEADSIIFDSDSSRDSGVFGEDEDQIGLSQWTTECDAVWSYCSAGAVVCDPNQLPNWFNDNFTTISQAELGQTWRLSILDNLRNRVNETKIDISGYEKAIEMSSWVKTGEAKAAKPFEPFEECILELEWVSASGCGLDTGTLTILNPDGVTTKIQFSLSEITCVMSCSESGSPRLAIHAPRLPPNSSPVKIQFNGDTDLEDWLSHLTSVCCQINDVQGKPSPHSIWFISNIGDVFAFDPLAFKTNQYQSDTNLYKEEIDLSAAESPYQTNLYSGMPIGSLLEIYGSVYDDADHIRFDLTCHPTVRVRHKVEKLRHITLHLNPRINENTIVLNSMEQSEWGNEIRIENKVFAPGMAFKLIIRCESEGFRIYIDDTDLYLYKHKNAPEAVSGLFVSGRVKLFKISYYSTTVIVPPRDIFLRQIGGHLKKVETCSAGITWGIGYDNTAWVYTGGWGGTFLKGLSTNTVGINAMSDTHIYYIYENQRWNPLSGYISHGLPTDRHMWSDITGKQKRSKEHTKLLSIHWQWISDWLVDFHTPGGVDRDGWQYAVDFPANYHGKKQFTDYVRRRRWYRKCRLTTSGPWHELGNSKIIDLSLQVPEKQIQITDLDSTSEETESVSVNVWAIASNGDALYRYGVTQQTPVGTAWDHVPTEQPLLSISCSSADRVWAIGRNGSVFIRKGISDENHLGDKWQSIDCPNGVSMKQISVGPAGVWAVDTTGRLIIRRDITAQSPYGKQWYILINIPNDPPHSEGNVGFKSVSVGHEVWAISHTGYLCKRYGITENNPIGTGWNLGITGNFHHVSANSLC